MAIRQIALLLLVAASALTAIPASSQPITKATWVTPNWEGYIDEQGKGLYADVISAIFGKAGIEIKISYRPWNRSLFEVENGVADFTGADSRSEKFAQPRTPIVRSTEVVFFKKSKTTSIRNAASLSGKTGVWVLGYTDNLPEEVKKHLQGKGNPSREAAFKMLLLGRADYYLDNDFQLAQTMK